MLILRYSKLSEDITLLAASAMKSLYSMKDQYHFQLELGQDHS